MSRPMEVIRQSQRSLCKFLDKSKNVMTRFFEILDFYEKHYLVKISLHLAGSLYDKLNKTCFTTYSLSVSSQKSNCKKMMLYHFL